MHEITVKLGSAGRLTIPASFRKALAISEGDHLILRLKEDRLELLTQRQAIKNAQDLVRRYIPAGSNLAADLITERRQEAARE